MKLPKMVGAGFVPLLLAVHGFAGTGPLARAEEEYQRADYRAAVASLLSLPTKDAAAYALLGKAYYMDGQYENSTDSFERAMAEDPRNSRYYDWLGKAYGRRAEKASLFTALKYANKTRDAFEKSVALDGGNIEALGDLFEYYLEAPSQVGGGLDKAEGVALRIRPLNEAEYHHALARIAEKRKDMRLAEQELRTAIELAPNQAGRVIDLARFLSKQGRYRESDELFLRATRIAPGSPTLLFERAAAYIHSGRNVELAKALLRHYPELSITPDDPPRAEAARLLAEASSR